MTVVNGDGLLSIFDLNKKKFCFYYYYSVMVVLVVVVLLLWSLMLIATSVLQCVQFLHLDYRSLATSVSSTGC